MRVREFMKAGHPKTLLCAFLYFDVSFMVWVMMGALGVYIAREFHLSSEQKGLLVAVPILGGALLRLPFGSLADAIGGRRTAIIGMVATLIPLLGTWLYASSYSTLLGLGLLLGIAGASFAVALPMASRWYPPEHQGTAMGIAGAGNSGTVLAALFAPALAELVGWRAVFGLATIPLLLVLALFAVMAKDNPSQPKKAGFAEYWSVCKQADCYWFCAFYMMTFGGFVGLASFLPTFFFDQYGVTKVQGGQLTAICVVAGSFLRPVGGYLADRFGGVTMLRLLYILLAATLIGASTLPVLWVAVPVLFVTMGLLGMGNGAVFQLVPQRFGKQIGVITGLIGAAGGAGGFFVPNVFGIMKGQTGSYGSAFLIFASVSLACVGALTFVAMRWKRAQLSVTD